MYNKSVLEILEKLALEILLLSQHHLLEGALLVHDPLHIIIAGSRIVHHKLIVIDHLRIVDHRILFSPINKNRLQK